MFFTARACAILIAALPLATSAAVAVRGSEAPPARTVREISWEGVDALVPKDLEGVILTTKASRLPWKERRPFEDDVLEGDTHRLVSHYRQNGYYETTVEARAEETGPKAVRVVFEVREGEPVRLAAFDFSLLDVPEGTTEVSLQDGLSLEVGEIFSVVRYRESRERVLNRLADVGYPAARIQGGADVTLESHEALVRWRAYPGPRVYLGEFSIEGLERVERALLLRELPLQKGELYSRKRLRAAQRALYDLGLFASVTIEAHRPGKDARKDALWPVEVRVQEREPRSVRFGLGYGTEDRFRARAGWHHRNFLGGRRSLAVKGKFSSLIQGVDATFVQPRFIDWDTDLTLDLQIAQETTPAFDSEGVALGWSVERPIFEKVTVRAGQRFELQKVTDVEADDPLVTRDEDESFRLSLLQFGLRRVDVDSVVDPHRGTWLDLSFEPSFKALGSEVDYLRTVLDLRSYTPLGPTVLAARLRLGALEPLRDDGAGAVPIFKRFFSGGSASVRGFDLDRLGPLDENEDPIGGLTVVEAGIELRFPLWKQLGGVVFADAGQVNRRAFHVDGDDIFYTSGVGIRYATPIGPLRVDLAQILNPPSGIQPFRIHFSIGHAF
jgi:outer membrane protein insertion porin family/translocation and assembly module TamA